MYMKWFKWTTSLMLQSIKYKDNIVKNNVNAEFTSNTRLLTNYDRLISDACHVLMIEHMFPTKYEMHGFYIMPRHSINCLHIFGSMK